MFNGTWKKFNVSFLRFACFLQMLIAPMRVLTHLNRFLPNFQVFLSNPKMSTAHPESQKFSWVQSLLHQKLKWTMFSLMCMYCIPSTIQQLEYITFCGLKRYVQKDHVCQTQKLVVCSRIIFWKLVSVLSKNPLYEISPCNEKINIFNT